jgi:hypothetical protein
MCVFVCLALLVLHLLWRQNCFLLLWSYYLVLTSGECMTAELCVHISSFLSLNGHSLLSKLFLPPEQPIVVLTCTSYINTHSLFHTVSAKSRHRSFPTLLQSFFPYAFLNYVDEDVMVIQRPYCNVFQYELFLEGKSLSYTSFSCMQ